MTRPFRQHLVFGAGALGSWLGARLTPPAVLVARGAHHVVGILEKMQQPATGLRVEIDADRAEDHPKVFTEIRLRFVITGEVDQEKAERAVALSAEKFCSVSAMLRPGVAISHAVVVEP